MQQYFVAGQAQDVVTITDKDTVKHMFNVMRLTEDEEVVLVFDDHIKRLAKVIDSAEHCFEIIEELDSNVEMPVEVTIAAGFPKGDKLEFLAQKGTELGMANLWAFPADWSVVKWDGKKLAKKADKLAKIALGAAEQSKRNVIPGVTLFDKKAAFLAELDQFDKIFIAYEESAKQGELANLAKVFQELTDGSRILAIFGPEGGLAPEEVEAFVAKGGILCGLGPRILRTETAPLYLLSAASYQWELTH